MLRAFCCSPGYPMDVVARNAKAFRQNTEGTMAYHVIEPPGGDATLPPSLPYDQLHLPAVADQMLSQLNTRGWAVLKLGENMRGRLAKARKNALDFFTWEDTAKRTVSMKGNGPSAGWGGVLRTERRENFTYNPYYTEKDRLGWIEDHPNWMASVMDVSTSKQMSVYQRQPVWQCGSE